MEIEFSVILYLEPKCTYTIMSQVSSEEVIGFNHLILTQTVSEIFVSSLLTVLSQIHSYQENRHDLVNLLPIARVAIYRPPIYANRVRVGPKKAIWEYHSRRRRIMGAPKKYIRSRS